MAVDRSYFNYPLIKTEKQEDTVWVFTRPNLLEAIRVYNSSGVLLQVIPFRNIIVNMVQYGNTVWICAKEKIHMYDASTREFSVEFQAHTDAIMSLCVVGEYLWTGDVGGTIHVWQHADGKICCVKTMNLHLGAAITDITFMEPHYVVSSAKKQIIVWNAETNTPVQDLATFGTIFKLCTLPTGLVSVDPYKLQLWSTSREAEASQIKIRRSFWTDSCESEPSLLVRRNVPKLKRSTIGNSLSDSRITKKNSLTRSHSETKLEVSSLLRKQKATFDLTGEANSDTDPSCPKKTFIL